MTHAWNRPVLRPRTLTVDLFARALDGEATAEDDLRLLTVDDPVAQRAHEALVVADLEHLHGEGLSGHDAPAIDAALIERVLANLETVRDDPSSGCRRGLCRRCPDKRRPTFLEAGGLH